MHSRDYQRQGQTRILLCFMVWLRLVITSKGQEPFLFFKPRSKGRDITSFSKPSSTSKIKAHSIQWLSFLMCKWLHIKAKNSLICITLEFLCNKHFELRTLLTIVTWESSFRELTLFTSNPLPRLEPPLNHSSFHLSIASKSLQTCLPLFHASSIIFTALGASCLHQAPLEHYLHVSTPSDNIKIY